jgi:glycosyltransferase A (GT-A) superfamily protein (DUF2064 family)
MGVTEFSIPRFCLNLCRLPSFCDRDDGEILFFTMAEGINSLAHSAATSVAPGAHAVVVMAKAPITGAVKSRLVPPLTEDQAAALNRCFIRDVCASIEAATAIVAADGNARVPGGNADSMNRNAHIVGLIAYTPAGAQTAFDGLVPASFKFIEQRGNGLTARLTNVAADLLAAGYDSVSLMNSDSPTIPPAFIAEAVTHLARPGDDCLAQSVTHLGRTAEQVAPGGDRHAHAGDRLAIIGADDGGYCLIGLTRPHWRVFEEIAWSNATVLAQTLQRAAELRLIVLQTASWYDIDDADSLRRLISELFGELSDKLSGESPGSPPGTYPLPQEALKEQMSKNLPGIHPLGSNASSEKSSSNPPAIHSLGRKMPSENRKSQSQSENSRLQNKANFFAAPATRAWLSEALANGLAARLGLASSARSVGQPPHARPRS